jgi:hypothetical protein
MSRIPAGTGQAWVDGERASAVLGSDLLDLGIAMPKLGAHLRELGRILLDLWLRDDLDEHGANAFARPCRAGVEAEA